MNVATPPLRRERTSNGQSSAASRGVPSTDPAILNSWKEISQYLGRGVRTVQRWETDYGLPVRRPGGHIRGSVFCLRHELDEWTRLRKMRMDGHHPRPAARECDAKLLRAKELSESLLLDFPNMVSDAELLRRRLEEIQALIEHCLRAA